MKRLFWRYATSYIGITLLSCSIIGLLLFFFSVHELTDSSRREQTNKLELAAEYLDNQKDLMQEIAYKIQNTLCYRPSQLAINSYKEMLLLKDFGQYANSVPIMSEYFLFYHDQEQVFRSASTIDFDLLLRNQYGIDDSRELFDVMNQLSGFAVLRSDENPDCAFMAMPVYTTDRDDPAGQATLCFVVEANDLRKRLDDVIGAFNGNVTLLFGSQLVCTDSPDYLDNLELFRITGGSASSADYIFARSADNSFTAILQISDHGLYDRLYAFRQFCFVIIIIVAAFLLTLAAYMAYRNFKPLSILVTQYEKAFPLSHKDTNAVGQIADILSQVTRENQTFGRQLSEEIHKLDQQREIIQSQLVQLLMNGSLIEGRDDILKNLGIPVQDPCFCVAVLRPDPIDGVHLQRLITLIRGLSDDAILFYPVNIESNNEIAVLLVMSDQAQAHEAIELIDAIGEEEEIVMSVQAGLVCDDFRKIHLSFMDALSRSDHQDPRAIELIPGQKPGDIHDLLHIDLTLPKIIKVIEAGDQEQALLLLDQFICQVKETIPSLVIQRCVIADILNAIIRMSYRNEMDLDQIKIGTAFLTQDMDTFRNEIEYLISNLCAQISRAKAERADSAQQRIIEYVRINALTYDISLASIADAFHMTQRQVSRVIKEVTGSPYKEYLTSIRIAKACDLLIRENLSVSEVSERIGFINISYFIRIFKNSTGETPASYKKKCAQSDAERLRRIG